VIRNAHFVIGVLRPRKLQTSTLSSLRQWPSAAKCDALGCFQDHPTTSRWNCDMLSAIATTGSSRPPGEGLVESPHRDVGPAAP
jgi:hypothetical protein